MRKIRKKRKIRSCLFWYEDNKMTVVLKKTTRMETLKFEGDTVIYYTENFWDDWKENVGYSSDSQTDFCIISDKELPVPADLEESACDSSESIWFRKKIEDTVKGQLEKILPINKPVEIKSEDGTVLFRIGNFQRTGTEKISMTAKYRKVVEEAREKRSEDAKEETPYSRYQRKKLAEYDRNIEG